MRRVSRKFKRHFGVAARQMAVRAPRVWYWQLGMALVYMLVGYLFAYWYLTGGDFGSMTNSIMRMTRDNQQLQSRSVQTERQLQVAQAAQVNLAKALSDMQDESLQLKEDVEFYKNILSEQDSANGVKVYSFKIIKGAQRRQYDYHILLVQSGRHDKAVQGTLKLVLLVTQEDQQLTLPVNNGSNTSPVIDVNFKYYQRIDGSFSVPKDADAHAMELNFNEAGSAAKPGSKPTLSQKMDIPG